MSAIVDGTRIILTRLGGGVDSIMLQLGAFAHQRRMVLVLTVVMVGLRGS